MQDERVGLVGPNGAGKSTLLSAISGRRELDGGRVFVKPGVTVGYLVQTAVSGSNRTAWEEAADGMFRVRAAEERLAEARRRVLEAGGEAPPAAVAEELAAAQYNFVSVGGDTKELRIARVPLPSSHSPSPSLPPSPPLPSPLCLCLCLCLCLSLSLSPSLSGLRGCGSRREG